MTRRLLLGVAATCFSNRSLRGLVAGHLGREYTTSQVGYDLRRLRLHDLIQRLDSAYRSSRLLYY